MYNPDNNRPRVRSQMAPVPGIWVHGHTPVQYQGNLPMHISLPDGRVVTVLLPPIMLPPNDPVPELQLPSYPYLQVADQEQWEHIHTLPVAARNTHKTGGIAKSMDIPDGPTKDTVAVIEKHVQAANPQLKRVQQFENQDGKRNLESDSQNVNQYAKESTTQYGSKTATKKNGFQGDANSMDKLEIMPDPKPARNNTSTSKGSCKARAVQLQNDVAKRITETCTLFKSNVIIKLSNEQVTKFQANIQGAARLLTDRMTARSAVACIEDALISDKAMMGFQRKARLFAPYTKNCTVCEIMEHSLMHLGYSDLFQSHLSVGEYNKINLKDRHSSYFLKLTQYRYMHRLKPMVNYKSMAKEAEVKEHTCAVFAICEMVLKTDVIRNWVKYVVEPSWITDSEVKKSNNMTRNSVIIVTKPVEERCRNQVAMRNESSNAVQQARPPIVVMVPTSKLHLKQPNSLVMLCTKKIKRNPIFVIFNDKRIRNLFRKGSRMRCPSGRRPLNVKHIENSLIELIANESRKLKSIKKVLPLKTWCEKSFADIYRDNVGCYINRLIQAALRVSSYEPNKDCIEFRRHLNGSDNGLFNFLKYAILKRNKPDDKAKLDYGSTDQWCSKNITKGKNPKKSHQNMRYKLAPTINEISTAMKAFKRE